VLQAGFSYLDEVTSVDQVLIWLTFLYSIIAAIRIQITLQPMMNQQDYVKQCLWFIKYEIDITRCAM
jgi:hypothetical protein